MAILFEYLAQTAAVGSRILMILSKISYSVVGFFFCAWWSVMMDPAEAPEVVSRRPEYIREGVLCSALNLCYGCCISQYWGE